MTYRGLSRRVHFDSLPSPVERFALKELIGEGTYGDVYSAKDNLTGKDCHQLLTFLSQPEMICRFEIDSTSFLSIFCR